MEFSLAGPSCNTSGGSTTCTIDGSATISVRIDSFSKLTGGAYTSFDAVVQYSGAQLSFKPRSQYGEIVWPDCDFPAEHDKPGQYYAGCAVFPGSSTFTGAVVEMDFNCSGSGTAEISLIHTPGSTNIVDETQATIYDDDGEENLNITCFEPSPPPPTPPWTPTQTPTPTRTPTRTPTVAAVGGFAKLSGPEAPPTTTAADHGDGVDVGPGVAAITAIAGLGLGVSWALRRRRSGS